jgi:hypothetical protein
MGNASRSSSRFPLSPLGGLPVAAQFFSGFSLNDGSARRFDLPAGAVCGKIRDCNAIPALPERALAGFSRKDPPNLSVNPGCKKAHLRQRGIVIASSGPARPKGVFLAGDTSNLHVYAKFPSLPSCIEELDFGPRPTALHLQTWG